MDGDVVFAPPLSTNHKHYTPDKLFVYDGGFSPAISLFSVNKQISREAAEVFYSMNEFVFAIQPVMAERSQEEYRVGDRVLVHPPAYGLVCVEDNFSALAPTYCRMIKECRVWIDLPPYSLGRDFRSAFLHCKAEVACFAAVFNGKEHELESIAVRLRNPWSHEWLQYSLVRSFQNVAEPLATIHGVKKEIVFEGSSAAFTAKMCTAMKSSAILCAPKEDVYKTRMITRNGRKRDERYSTETYYETKFDWLEADREVEVKALGWRNDEEAEKP